MAVRDLVHIDEDKCTGCGDCVSSCAEGAIQVVDGKAKLVSDIYCDGLGACLGHCPEDAITIVRAEARPFDEVAVERHLAAVETRAELPRAAGDGPAPVPVSFSPRPQHSGGGCPGSRTMSLAAPGPSEGALGEASQTRPSELRQWPVQLHLVSPQAPHFENADVLLAADCVAFSMGDFHRDHLRGNALAVACPKLDQGQEAYLAKLTALIDERNINTLTVMVMEVPCCNGLLALAQTAAARASRKIPIKRKVVGIRGDVLAEEWI